MGKLQALAVEGARLWDQRQDEPDLAYEVFTLYRDMGQARSLERLSCVFADAKQVEYWSKLYKWRTRCEAFDHWQEMEIGRRVEESLEKMSYRHRKITRMAQSLVVRELRWYLEKAKDTGRFERLLTGSQLARLMKDAVTLERLIAGEATERVEGSSDALMDYSLLSTTELDMLRDLVVKAKKSG